MKTKQSLIGVMVICFAATVFAVNGFGAVPGDMNGSGNVDLHDVILAIQVCAGMNPAGTDAGADVNGDGKIGLQEAVSVALQVALNRNWYKDADRDGYSDGITQVAIARPSDIFYEKSELIAVSGDKDDNDPAVHPDTEGKWIPFDESDPADSSADAVSVDVPVSTTEEVVIEYGVPGMKVAEMPEDGDIYKLINISDCGYTSEIGKPQLPVIRRYVAVPEGAAVKTEILDSDYRDIEGYSVYPVQEAMPDIENAAELPFTMDADLYRTDTLYPSEIVTAEDTVVIRGVSAVILGICPVQFNPVKQTVRLYSYLKVKVSFQGGTRSSVRRQLRSPSFDTILNRLLLNPQNVFSGKETRAAYDSGDSLLIITHPNFLDAATALKNWKIMRPETRLPQFRHISKMPTIHGIRRRHTYCLSAMRSLFRLIINHGIFLTEMNVKSMVSLMIAVVIPELTFIMQQLTEMIISRTSASEGYRWTHLLRQTKESATLLHMKKIR